MLHEKSLLHFAICDLPCSYPLTCLRWSALLIWVRVLCVCLLTMKLQSYAAQIPREALALLNRGKHSHLLWSTLHITHYTLHITPQPEQQTNSPHQSLFFQICFKRRNQLTVQYKLTSSGQKSTSFDYWKLLILKFSNLLNGNLKLECCECNFYSVYNQMFWLQLRLINIYLISEL